MGRSRSAPRDDGGRLESWCDDVSMTADDADRPERAKARVSRGRGRGASVRERGMSAVDAMVELNAVGKYQKWQNGSSRGRRRREGKPFTPWEGEFGDWSWDDEFTWFPNRFHN